jgi:hypothetical protein
MNDVTGSEVANGQLSDKERERLQEVNNNKRVPGTVSESIANRLLGPTKPEKLAQKTKEVESIVKKK